MSQTFDSDVRYGSSFLDVDNNEQSVAGEILSDKISGEVYIKRPSDEKIVSFRQKSHTTYEMLREFNIQLHLAQDFTYPTGYGTYLIESTLGVDEFTKKNLKKNMLSTYKEFSGINNEYTISISPESNGFFLKPIIRPVDRNICEYMTGLFNKHEEENFSGCRTPFSSWSYSQYRNKYNNWKNTSSWKHSDCNIDMTLTTRDGGIVATVDFTALVRAGEMNYIPLPKHTNVVLSTISARSIKINKISFPKMQYERYNNYTNETDSKLPLDMQNMLEPDYKVIVNSIKIYNFIDDKSQIPNTPYIKLTKCIDSSFLQEALVYIDNSENANAVISQPTKPDIWKVNTMWAEELRKINEDGTVSPLDGEPIISELEEKIYKPKDSYIEFTLDHNDSQNLLVVNREG